MIKLSLYNSKLNALQRETGLVTASFDLPAGYTCPAASVCATYANRTTGKLTHGPHAKFNCYAAKTEAYASSTRKMRWANFDFIRNTPPDDTVDELTQAIRKIGAGIIRIHSSGDFFSRKYFNTWIETASRNPGISFYGYTKILAYASTPTPDNMSLVYSYGGKFDTLFDAIEPANRPPACYVWTRKYNPPEAVYTLPVICRDKSESTMDYQFITNKKSFVLMEH